MVFCVCVWCMCMYIMYIELQLLFSFMENLKIFGYFYDFYAHYIICLSHQSFNTIIVTF